jgi:two-component system cell cycle response regulator
VRTLVADDDITARVITQRTVETLGHDCRAVDDGAGAWDIFRSWRPEVVISDWAMPGMSGIELCRSIRATAADGYTYFVMVSRHRGFDEILKGMDAGADDYLLKPLASHDLEASLIAADRVTSLHRKLAEQKTELEWLNEQLTALTRRDPLTGLVNRRALEEDLDQLEARVRRYGHRYCMALIDIDQFKSYNDTYGHQAGDEVLRVVAAQLKAHTREGDEVYRYGGEEFLCVFPEQSLATGILAVQRMRIGLEQLAIPHAGSPGAVLTFSAGLAMLQPGHPKSTSQVLKEADDALYRAKQLGRNRIEGRTESVDLD